MKCKTFGANTLECFPLMCLHGNVFVTSHLKERKKDENHALSVHDITNKEFQLIRQRHGGLSHSMALSIRCGNYFGVCESLWECLLTILSPCHWEICRVIPTLLERKKNRFPLNDIFGKLLRQCGITLDINTSIKQIWWFNFQLVKNRLAFF